MTREQAKEAVKSSLETYLHEKGINTRRRFTCLNPEHTDRNPSMQYDEKRRKAHCFSCGVDYDMFDLIGIEYGLTNSGEIFQKAYEIFRVSVDREEKTNGKTNGKKSVKQGPGENHEGGLAPFLQACHERIHETDYPQKRGLSDEVIRRFRLGYDPRYTRGTARAWHALIIPTGADSYVARNMDPEADKQERYRKQGAGGLYNSGVMWEAEKPVFVVEGEIDALSVMSVGGEAVALGSTANVKRFLAAVEARRPQAPLLLALDHDQGGQAAADELADGLQKLQTPFYRLNPFGDYKDANEALTGDREAFTSAVKSGESIEEEARNAKREDYMQTSVAAHLRYFMDGIADSVNTPYVPTGFLKLDNLLDGGLYEGLYIVGAISSLGKTSLMTQIADQIAAAGGDVVIFSMEMARHELMAKSISRHTLTHAMQSGMDTRNAKTTRGITTGKRYPFYSNEEWDLIDAAMKEYGAYAGNLYISEGIGDIGVAEIRETVDKHIRFTGKRPVVIIDYLQIVAPHSERATDKQNTDKAVLEMKRISRDYKVPVVGISSFNRQNYSQPVTMEAYKESGAIEYSSDVLLGLQLEGAGTRDFDPTEAKKKNPRSVELVVLKNRNGALGEKIRFDYYPLFNYFQEG